MSLAFHNGQFVKSESIFIDPADYGFARGFTIFDPTRVYGGVPFRLDDHLMRFMNSAKRLDIPCPYSIAGIRQVVQRLCAYNKFPHSQLHICLTAGPCLQPGKIGFADSSNFVPNLMIFEHDFKPLHPEAPKGLPLYQQGFSLKTVPFSRDMPEVKLTNYVHGFLAIREASKEGFQEILYTHKDGYVTEASISNFFCVIDGALVTPARGMLFGVTRKVVLELAEQYGLVVAERDLTPTDVQRASEAFLASSFTELMPICRIDDHHFATTLEGPVFSALRSAFTRYIGEYCEQQSRMAA